MIVAVLLFAAGVSILAHLAPFPFLLEAIHNESSVWRMPATQSDKKTIYLTFDDGPNPTATPALLDLLKEKKVPATFFLIDDYVNEATAPIVRRMFEEGHAVGQHTGRRWLFVRSPSYIDEMVRSAATKIERVTGHRPCPLFRPHAGWRSSAMITGVRRAGYRIVGWSWMSWDWVGFRKRTATRVASQLAAHAAPGKIIVIHDGHHRNPTADRAYAVAATRQLIDELTAKGYTFRALC